jgi:NAD(P)-dependent dehydrogenase (short-subunit alcohol dehydrogenase family)
MLEIRGKVAVVTGAARGIGRALVERLVDEGASVMLADLDRDEADRVAGELRARHAGAALATARVDVSSAAEVDALASATIEAFGKVHLVFNNAGVAGRAAPLWQQSTEDWTGVLGPNLWGVIHGVRSFVPLLLAQREGGHVMNTASMAGLVSIPSLGPYHVSKHGVVTLSEVLHHELTLLRADIGVSVLCPGFVKTDIAAAAQRRMAEQQRPEDEGNRPMQQKFLQLVEGGIPAEQVARAALDAVRERRFYVLTHPEMKGAIKARVDEILGERTPTFKLG